jgi:hypothetical protein
MCRLAAKPNAAMTVSVTKIAIAAPFLDLHDWLVALKSAKWGVHCGVRRRSDPAQQGKHHERRS